ncbi:MAG TPA: hypothetical protein VKB47_12450 [Terracidiphilus sp.]|nr:hypothetical protein [Terracidiphilus sp.]
MMRSGSILLIVLTALPLGVGTVLAQEMHLHEGPAVPSSQLTIRGLDGKSTTMSPEELAALPHK